jgi:serine/threonine protein kinase
MNGSLELLDAAESLGLLTGPRSGELRASWRSSPGLSADDAARHLVQSGLLTRFQADRLLDGDGRSLVVQGRYHLRDLLGAGGMGQVYLARDTQLGRDVALKLLPPHLVRDEHAVARFRREAKAMARLAHPNIV